jgi:hypothetical protein
MHVAQRQVWHSAGAALNGQALDNTTAIPLQLVLGPGL